MLVFYSFRVLFSFSPFTFGHSHTEALCHLRNFVNLQIHNLEFGSLPQQTVGGPAHGFTRQYENQSNGKRFMIHKSVSFYIRSFGRSVIRLFGDSAPFIRFAPAYSAKSFKKI